MNVGEDYDKAIGVIKDAEAFAHQLTKIVEAEFEVLFQQHPFKAISFFGRYFLSTNHSHLDIPIDLEETIREKYEMQDSKSLHWQQMLDLYFSKDYHLALAYEIKRRVPRTNFSSFLALQKYRNPKPSILKNKKFMSSTAVLLFGIAQKTNIEILKGIKIKPYYSKIPENIFNMFWVVLILIAFLTILFQGTKYIKNYKYEKLTLDTAERTFLVGKIIEEYERS